MFGVEKKVCRAAVVLIQIRFLSHADQNLEYML